MGPLTRDAPHIPATWCCRRDIVPLRLCLHLYNETHNRTCLSGRSKGLAVWCGLSSPGLTSGGRTLMVWREEGESLGSCSALPVKCLGYLSFPLTVWYSSSEESETEVRPFAKSLTILWCPSHEERTFCLKCERGSNSNHSVSTTISNDYSNGFGTLVWKLGLARVLWHPQTHSDQQWQSPYLPPFVWAPPNPDDPKMLNKLFFYKVKNLCSVSKPTAGTATDAIKHLLNSIANVQVGSRLKGNFPASGNGLICHSL